MQLEKRIAALDWGGITQNLDAFGVATVGPLLDAEECRQLRSLYAVEGRFRSHIVMARHGFGQGEYKYFASPLPDMIGTLRHAFYPPLAPVANEWHRRMGMEASFPPLLEEFLQICHDNGQKRPTPLLLKYGAGDYNCLHQDIYGAHVFPIQLVILLSAPAEEFSGGEFVMTEQRPRMQSRAEVVHLKQGEGALFAVSDRPRQGTKGDYRVRMRHGVSRIRDGERYTLGVIFHDAA